MLWIGSLVWSAVLLGAAMFLRLVDIIRLIALRVSSMEPAVLLSVVDRYARVHDLAYSHLSTRAGTLKRTGKTEPRHTFALWSAISISFFDFVLVD